MNTRRTQVKSCIYGIIHHIYQLQFSKPSYLTPNLLNCLCPHRHTVSELVDVSLVYVCGVGLHLLPKQV